MPPQLFTAVLEPLRHVYFIIPLLFILTGLRWLLLPGLKGAAGERRLRRELEKVGHPSLHNLLLPAGSAETTQVDHVVRLPGCLLVIETKNYAGQIFGREREARWTHRLGWRSHAFQNPLRQNFAHCEALRSLLPGIPVAGLVVFVGTATFPRGVPQGVTTLAGLKEAIAPLLAAPSTEGLEHAWDRLRPFAAATPEQHAAHVKRLRKRRGADRQRLAGWMFLLTGLAGAAALKMLL